jgi:hypothetical protein
VSQLEQQYRFLYSAPGDLRVGDIPALLAEYKRLARAEIAHALTARRQASSLL